MNLDFWVNILQDVSIICANIGVIILSARVRRLERGQ